jgi:bifunctional enzyme CysN/CysC
MKKMEKQYIDINEFLNQDEKKDLLRILTAGSVDDGKSTLIGRLLFDSKKLYEDQLAALQRDTKKVGNAGEEIDYALLLDGLKAEREQGITIDVAYRYFSTNKRKFIIADTPGHEQYTRNMITGGSTANLAIILVDARAGIITQTKRHTYLISLLGIKHVVLAVNKMDLVNYSQVTYDAIVKDYENFVAQLGITDIHPIPLSALKGDNVVDVSKNMDWYQGRCLLNFLENVYISSDRNFEDFRYPVQYVLRPNLDFRGFSGKVASGIVKKGDEIMVLPSLKKSKVKGIHTYEGEINEAFAPQGITITLEDEIDISRGDMIVHPNNQPRFERHFEAMLVWMDEKEMDINSQFIIKHTTKTTKARIDKLQYKIDVNTLEEYQVTNLVLNEIGRAIITTNLPLAFDPYKKNRNTGSFILIDPITHNTCAVGMIIDKLDKKNLYSRITDMDQEKMNKGNSLITDKDRQNRYGQKGQTIWITGLHGSGKRNLAYTLEKKLFEEGKIVVVLDGASVRAGLSHELEYTPSDRAEHLRRVAHMCNLLNNQGIITICAFISPLASIRQQIKTIIGEERFTMVYTDEPLDICKQNQPELYDRFEKGEIINVPGLDVVYEKPEEAILVKSEKQTDALIHNILVLK